VLTLTYPIRCPWVTDPDGDCSTKRVNAVFDTPISESNFRETVTRGIAAAEPISGSLSYVVCFKTTWAALLGYPSSWHRLGPGDMRLESNRPGHAALKRTSVRRENRVYLRKRPKTSGASCQD
jgi:hypothetical protein